MTLWLLAAAALALSFLSDVGFNRIVLEGQRLRDANAGPPAEGGQDTLSDLYRLGLPPLLRRFAILETVVEKGGSTFFFAFAAAAITLVYQRTGSFGWVVAAVPLLIGLFFATNLAAVHCARHAFGKRDNG